ncbi:MAG: tRNA (adenosine(37)-N6)-threonylcarbamoyltransferase complex dimerization subunit type 1 TsaB [Actinomycetaceae bacterium]|nr:tRNA (adenosine(37)-N6)-threonylcarbamoyltransferase complex dimerization subunit type 1 TsaB [Actinomycetaceae bacterium]
MRHLCIDTSSATSVAVVADGHILAQARHDSARHHVEALSPLIRQVLADAGLDPTSLGAQVDAICVGTGPAPFTGLRAGLVTARVLARAAGLPLWGVPSLAIMARQALDLADADATVTAISDARRKELYWGTFKGDGPDDLRLIGDLEVGAPGEMANQASAAGALLISEGPLPAHAAAILTGEKITTVDALDLSALSRIVSARLAKDDQATLGIDPLYLRRPDIHGQAPQRM